MKRTQIRELFSNIKVTFVSFFSILMFVALGVGLFVGISWTAPALQSAADRVFDEGSFHDFSVQFPYGLTESDLSELRDVEGVSDLEAGRSSYQRLNGEDTTYTVKVMSLTKDMDVPLQVEGDLPTHVGQIALEASWARAHGYGIGDTIRFEHDGETDDSDGMKLLTGDTYTVTALMESPAYLAYANSSYGFSTIGSGSIDCLMFAPATVFDAEAYQQGFTDIFIRSDELRGLPTFSDEYQRKSDEIKERISDVGSVLASARYADLHHIAETKVNEGESQLQAAATRIAEGRTLIASGEAQLAQGKTQISLVEKQLSSAFEQLQSGQSFYEVAKSQYDQAVEMLNASQSALGKFDTCVTQCRGELEGAKAYKDDIDGRLAAGEITQEEYNTQLDAYCVGLVARVQKILSDQGIGALIDVGSIDHSNFTRVLAAAERALDNAEDTEITVGEQTMTVGQARAKVSDLAAELSARYPQVSQAASQLESGWAEYYAGQEQLAAAKRQAAAGQTELETRKQQLVEGEQAYEVGVQQLDAGKQQLANMKEFSPVVLPRAYNGGVQVVATFGGITDNLRFSMAALFVIVGLLVCYSAVSRIVHEQLVQIGTKKALGLRAREITTGFLWYSALAVLAGSVVGLVVGVTVVEGILSQALGGRFITGVYLPYFSLWQGVLVSGVELVLILLATWFACRKVLKRHAIDLLAGEKPPSVKPRFFESWALWNKMSLLAQTIVNNCLNDRRRVLGTIIGVAGCTALIVTAVTLNNNVLASFSNQYDEVYHYDSVAYFDAGTQDAGAKTQEALAEGGARSTPVFTGSYTLDLPDGKQSVANVTVPGDVGTFGEFYEITPVSGSSGEVDLTGEGVWMSSAYAEHMGAKVGDEVTVTESTGEVHRLTIDGFFRYYLTNNQIVMGEAAYERVFGTPAVSNALLVDTNDADVTGLTQSLKGVEGFTTLVDVYAANKADFDSFAQVSRTVVAIYLALSALMAIVVLLNLNVMFIEEKKRELIVLMINGFSVRDAKGYIYRDTIVLTVIGIVAGVVLGAIMGSLTVLSIEPASASFVKGVDPVACLAGVFGSAVLAIIMSLIALRRIGRFELTDINRF